MDRGKLGVFTLSEGGTLHNKELCNNRPQSNQNSSEPFQMVYSWDYPIMDHDKIQLNRARLFSLSMAIKADQVKLEIHKVQKNLSAEQLTHINRRKYINQKEFDYRTELDRKK